MTPSTPLSKSPFGKVRQSTNSKPDKTEKVQPKLKMGTPIKPIKESIKPAKDHKIKSSSMTKVDKPSSKKQKGFFGTGKYIWWW